MEQAIVHSEPQAPQVIEKDFDIDGFIEKRKEFIEKVNRIMVDGKDYHVIQGRKSMAKGGAEKIASIFGWTAVFEKDADAMEAFSDLKDVICFVCNLHKNGAAVGQGRGAATLTKNADDPNKTIKMAQKSAFVDAVIRSSGLSDFYTQDLEDMEPSQMSTYPQSQNAAPRAAQSVTQSSSQSIAPSKNQYNLIGKLMEEKGYSKEDLIDVGFKPGTLTGGKDGTASELIDFLLKAKSKKSPNGTPVESGDDINVEDIPY